MNNEIARHRAVHHAMGRRAQSKMGTFIIEINTDNVELVRIAKTNVIYMGQFAVKHQVQ